MRLSEGFRWVFPLVFNPDAPLNLELESLSPDFWRFELEAATKYKPKDYKSGKNLKFDLKDFTNVVQKIKSDYSFYLGSQTTPPCLGK